MAALSDMEKTAAVNATNEYAARINALDPAQRDQQATSIANEVIKGMQKRETQEQLDGLRAAQARTMKAHGPGSPDEWSADKIKAYNEQRNAQIKALQQSMQGH
jgi:hypothetical protein